jgi:sialate O-acetylesterase
MQLASVFQDHMVLQRERPVPVWGTAAAGERIEVRCARKKAEALTGPDGRWRVCLPPIKAGGPFEFQVRAGKQKIRLQDVWVGEVWLASGQSNMGMTVSGVLHAGAEIADADHPGIRILTSARVALTQRQESLGAGSQWRVCRSSTVGNFTAAGYFFARELHQKLGVAVGIIDSSWGGTVAEAWTSRQGLQGHPGLKHYIDQLDRFLGPDGNVEREAVRKAQAAWADSIPKDPGNAGLADGWAAPDTTDADWKTMVLPSGWQAAGHDYSGVFWFRREVTVPAAWAGRDLVLHIGACDKRDFTYFNGEFMGSLGMEDRPDAWETPRVYTVPGRRVKTGRNVIAVRVFSEMYQGGMIGPKDEMWAAPAGAPFAERLSLAGDWKYRVERNFGQINTVPPVQTYGDGNPNTPSVLFNAMIAPVVPYALRGFIWYQGESNAARSVEYRTLMPTLIRDWRREFGREDLSFYQVQLANFMAVSERPQESDWAQLREAQRLTLGQVPRTGLAVAIDIGDAADIHPKNKQDVGRRLADCALALDYGKNEYAGSSPMPQVVLRTGADVTVRFSCAASGLTVREGNLKGFELAGPDRVFFSVKAAVTSSDTVLLDCAEVSDPQWVRYAWANNPVCNLYGGTGLPASPFESAIPAGEWLR